MQHKFLLLLLLNLIDFSFQKQPFTVARSNFSDLPRTLQSCQLGCLDCSSPDKCLTCDSETTLTGDVCICNQVGKYFESGSGCTGDCMEGCDECINNQECLTCSINRVWKDGKCKCESPRILIGNNCDCPSYMTENPTTLNCEYIDEIDLTYQSKVSPLFDAILQLQINPAMKFDLAPIILWSGDCTFKNSKTRLEFKTYLLSQTNDFLFIPSNFLDFHLQCDVTASYINKNDVEISKQISFTTLSSSQPQVHIINGPFQILSHTEINFILVEALSSTGKQIPSSSLQVTWTQTSGEDVLDLTKFYGPSNPLKLTIPKCTLSQGKLYTFKVSIKVGTSITSQEITLGAYSPKIQLQPLQYSSYHIYSDDLTLIASQFSLNDECNQGILPSDFLDLSTIMYSWEYVSVDLESTRLLPTELAEIADDPNISFPSDPLNLFYHSTNTPSLTIPSSYFTPLSQNSQLIFYLTVTLQSISSMDLLLQPKTHAITTKAYIQIVTSKPFTDVSFKCINKNNCEAYYQETNLIGTSYNPEYSYTWNVNVFDSLSGTSLYYYTYTTYLSISMMDPGVPPLGAKFVSQILLTITDGTNIASAFMTLPIDPAPQNGAISIYPPEGEAYKTNFLVITSGWIDNDLPLSFQFFTSFAGSDDNYLLKTFQPFDFTPLVPPPKQGLDWNIGVVVTNSLQITTQIEIPPTVTGGAQSWSELIERNNNALKSSRSSTNLFQRFRLISVIMQSLFEWERSMYDENYFIKSAEFKYLAITEMQNIFLNLNSPSAMNSLFLHNVVYSATNLEWNQDKNWELYMNVLDSNLQFNSSTLMITREESDMLTPILDNLLSSMIRPGNTIQNPDRIYAYVNTLVRNMIYGRTPLDAPIHYGKFFSAETYKPTYCQILQEGITRISYGSGLSANFTLKPGKTLQPEQCNNLVDFIFLAFRRNYTVEGGWGVEAKTIIYVDLRDSITGESLLSDLFDYFLISPIDLCPDGAWCFPTDGGTKIYGVFDLKDQILKIFAKSNIDQIGNFSVLQDFKFWKSVAFWAVLGVSIWFLLSFYWLYAKHPTYCALQANRTINQKSLFKKINLFFWLVHPLIGIYIFNDSKITKPTKLIIYYQSLIVVMVFSTLFSSIEKGEGYVFKGYIILFNTFTVTPINAILGRAFEWISKIKNPKKKIGPRIKLFLAFLVYLGILAASFIIMFVIEAQQDQSQNVSWAINFLISFIQDFTLSPLIGVTNKILLLRFAQNPFIRKSKVIQQIIAFFIPDSFKSIYESVFIVAPVLTPTSPTTIPDPLPTSPMSPPSSSRRLLKFGTLETVTPTKSHTPYDFRSRRASESEMNTADIIAMETLMSNRFQTLFSEAKPESVKAFSPIMKENFSKMQSSNLYSSQTNPKFTTRTSRTDDKKFPNLTSIIMSPRDVDAALSPEEEDIISLDFSPQDTYASKPKLWSPNQTLKSFVFKQKDKKEDRSKVCKTVV